MFNVTMTYKHREAEGISSFEFTRTDGAALGPFSAGSHIDVPLPSGQIRQYSLFNPPDDPHRFQIGVLLDPVSRSGSRVMLAFEEGSTNGIGELRNLFPLAHGAHCSLLIAGGIWVTSILRMAERLAQISAALDNRLTPNCSRSKNCVLCWIFER